MNGFLANRYQRIVLNSQTSELTSVNVGVPQGSILNPVLININDLSIGISSSPRLL